MSINTKPTHWFKVNGALYYWCLLTCNVYWDINGYHQAGKATEHWINMNAEEKGTI